MVVWDMNILILGEESEFRSELKGLVGAQINCCSVQVFLDNNDFFDKVKLFDVDVCLAVITTRNFKYCFKVADILMEKNSNVKIAFLCNHVLKAWVEKLRTRYIHLVSLASEDIVGDIERIISGEKVVPLAQKSQKFLASREEEVLQLLSLGKNQTVIAEELDISVSTVKTCVKNINHKLETPSKEAAVRRGIELGIIQANFEISEEF